MEERDLVALAPVLSLRDLARIFGRSEESIESKARELRQRGVDVAPLGRNATLVRCPECGRWRTGLGASGSCAGMISIGAKGLNITDSQPQARIASCANSATVA